MSEFETRVESLLDSADQSNFSAVQSQLIDLFLESENDDELRSDWAKRAYALTNRFSDDRRSLLLLSAALEVSWPEYSRGDGYFREPSDLASAATVIGVNNPDDSFFEYSKHLEPCAAIHFFDLGVVSNNSVSPENVMFAINRSNLDPVLAVAAKHPNKRRYKMPFYKVQREYINWEEITVEAESEQEALDKAEEDESMWEYSYDVNTYNFTGETWVGLDD